MSKVRRVKTVGKTEKRRVGSTLVQIIDTFQSTLQQQAGPKKKVSKVLASVVLADTINKNVKLNDVSIKPYMRGKRGSFSLNVGTALIAFNFIIFMFFAFMFGFLAFIDFTQQPLQDVGNSLVGGDDFWTSQLAKTLLLLHDIPQGFDYLFLSLIIIFIADLIYAAYRFESENKYAYVGALTVGGILFGVALSYISDLKDTLVSYLGSALLSKPSTPIFDFIHAYSLEFSVFVFFLILGINQIDFGAWKEKLISSNEDYDESDEVFKQ